jgi:hypothetical protein
VTLLKSLFSPIATQVVGDPQDTEVKMLASPGRDAETPQVLPPSWVVTAAPAPGTVYSPPTATQSLVLEHETAKSTGSPTPFGVSLVHVLPPSVVATIAETVDAAPVSEPTAMQWEADAQDTHSRPATPVGAEVGDQLFPALCEYRITVPCPTATQCVADPHDTDRGSVAPVGAASVVHELPPSLVSPIKPPVAPKGPADPTATHRSLLGQETELKVPSMEPSCTVHPAGTTGVDTADALVVPEAIAIQTDDTMMTATTVKTFIRTADDRTCVPRTTGPPSLITPSDSLTGRRDSC